MKALVCVRPFEMRVEERADPDRAADEVLIRIRRVGICGTDNHIYAGNHPFLAYPRLIGHELAGEVLEAPAGSHFAVGQVVTVNPYLACGRCSACRRARPNCCVDISVLGVHADGGLCERISVPERAVIDASGLTLDQAAMVEFLAIGAHAVQRAAVAGGDRVLVMGAGPIGIAVALFARIAGSTDVTLLDTRSRRLNYARDRFGFTAGVVAGPDAAAELAAASDGEMFDRVFDATGNIAAMRGGLAYVAHAGTYVLVGVCKDDLVFPDPEFHKRETALLASRNALSVDFAHVIACIRDGRVPTQHLQTHALSIDDVPDGMPRLIEEADSVLKVIVSV